MMEILENISLFLAGALFALVVATALVYREGYYQLKQQLNLEEQLKTVIH